MSEKLVDDYGMQKLATYLKEHCYAGGDGSTSQVATNDDIDSFVGDKTEQARFLTNDTYPTRKIWWDSKSIRETIKKDFSSYGREVFDYSILDSAHVTGNSIIYDYVVNLYKFRVVTPYVPYFNKEFVKSWVKACKEKYGSTIDAIKQAKLAEIKARYNAYQSTYNKHYAALGEQEIGKSAKDREYFFYIHEFTGASNYSKLNNATLKDDTTILGLLPNGTEIEPNIPYAGWLTAKYGSISKAIEHYLAEV